MEGDRDEKVIRFDDLKPAKQEHETWESGEDVLVEEILNLISLGYSYGLTDDDIINVLKRVIDDVPAVNRRKIKLL